MTAISITGPSRRLSGDEKDLVEQVISGLGGEPGRFFTGVAPEGVDGWAARMAYAHWPNADHVLAIPYWEGDGRPLPCPYDMDTVKELSAAGAKVVHCQPGATKAKGYMLRNSYLAEMCTHMLAFPETPEEEKRSGTWATVRRARKHRRPVLVTPLDGSSQYRLLPS